MVEPFSIVAACLGIANGLASITKTLKRFNANAINAQPEILALQSEASVFYHSLSQFDMIQFPATIEDDLLRVINECEQVVDQIKILISGIKADRLSGRLIWSFTMRNEVNHLRQNLAAYKAAIDIAVATASFSLGNSIKNDTSRIRDQVSRIPTIECAVFEISATLRALRQESNSNLQMSPALQQLFVGAKSVVGSVNDMSEAQIVDPTIVSDSDLKQPFGDATIKHQSLRTKKPPPNSSRSRTAGANVISAPVHQPNGVDGKILNQPVKEREQDLDDEFATQRAKGKTEAEALPNLKTSSQKPSGTLRKQVKCNDLRAGQISDAAPRQRANRAVLRESKSSITIRNLNVGRATSEQTQPTIPSERVTSDMDSTERVSRATCEDPLTPNSYALRKSKSSTWVSERRMNHTLPELVARNETVIRGTANFWQPLGQKNSGTSVHTTSDSGIAATLRLLSPGLSSSPREVTDNDFKLMAGLGSSSVSTPNLRLWDFADLDGHESYFEHDDNQGHDIFKETKALKPSFNQGWTKGHLRRTADYLCKVAIQHLKVVKSRATDEELEHWIKLEIQLSKMKDGPQNLPKYKPAKSCMSDGISHFLDFENLGDCEYAYSQMVPYTPPIRASSSTIWLSTSKAVQSPEERLVGLFTIAATLSAMFHDQIDWLKKQEGHAFGDCLGMSLFKAAGMRSHFSSRYGEPEVLSRRLYAMSASFGYVPALIELAECYSLGQGTPKDHDAFRHCRALWNYQMYLNGFTVWNDKGSDLGKWYWKDTIPDEMMWDYHSRRTEGEIRERKVKKSKSRLSLHKVAKSWWYGS
ncbi:hypothetical protein H2198_006884 [Neophaeococcomyces mojaviensis]|uniref:Uncharacterized protein n=1 Tax=Neophaeococcomyces mojaviensis TaxID=3383035 RepID=A0ACC3A1P8_9EURO|nr:hypothetical protein H2198_006884 [Knufia sp. JES_112]